MIGRDQTFFRSGEFAEMAGVTLRTLRFYDRSGLLSPSRRTEAGHRLYNISDLRRLEQIQTLKFIGLSLANVRRLMADADPDFKWSLQAQRRALLDKISHLKQVLETIEEAERSLGEENDLDWRKLARIIKAIQMEKDYEWFKTHYTQEQLDHLAERAWTPEDQAAVEQEWNELYSAVRTHFSDDPGSPEVQALAGKWLELIGRFTQGDPGITSGLEKAYSQIGEAPKEVKNEFQKNQDVFTYMNKAIAIYKKTHSNM